MPFLKSGEELYHRYRMKQSGVIAVKKKKIIIIIMSVGVLRVKPT